MYTGVASLLRRFVLLSFGLILACGACMKNTVTQQTDSGLAWVAILAVVKQ